MQVMLLPHNLKIPGAILNSCCLSISFHLSKICQQYEQNSYFYVAH